MNASPFQAVQVGAATGAGPALTGPEAIPVLLLLLFGVVLVTGAVIIFMVMRHLRLRRAADSAASRGRRHPDVIGRRLFGSGTFNTPNRWLAIRTRNLDAVQSALGLHNAVPCSWVEGLIRVSDQKLFLSPPINGWILVIGPHLPDPSDDIDAAFRFLQRLSRVLGEVQFYSANRVVGHHAWARLESGRVVRGYAWAGETLWNQGPKTWAERKLGVKCFEYGAADPLSPGQLEQTRTNAEKVALLAALWSVDPASIDGGLLTGAHGLAGDFSRAGLR